MAVSAPATLGDSVARLSGVGPSVAEALARLGIRTIRDLVFHLPSRYQDRTRVTPIGLARPPCEVVVEGTVLSAQVQFGRRRSLLCRIEVEERPAVARDGAPGGAGHRARVSGRWRNRAHPRLPGE